LPFANPKLAKQHSLEITASLQIHVCIHLLTDVTCND